jgi:hypothetical protein
LNPENGFFEQKDVSSPFYLLTIVARVASTNAFAMALHLGVYHSSTAYQSTAL